MYEPRGAPYIAALAASEAREQTIRRIAANLDIFSDIARALIVRSNTHTHTAESVGRTDFSIMSDSNSIAF